MVKLEIYSCPRKFSYVEEFETAPKIGDIIKNAFNNEELRVINRAVFDKPLEHDPEDIRQMLDGILLVEEIKEGVDER